MLSKENQLAPKKTETKHSTENKMHSKGKQSKIIPDITYQISVKVSWLRYQISVKVSWLRYQISVKVSWLRYRISVKVLWLKKFG